MTWPLAPLGTLLTLQRGYDLPEQHRRLGDVPVVTSSGVTGFHAESAASGPGVITGRYGTIGAVHYIKEDYWPHNTTLFVSDFKGNDALFVRYLLQSLNLAHQVSSGAVPGVNRNVLHAMLVPKVPRTRQHKIAQVLSAYDDLIENNRRRMALLEQAARLLYDEWFVRLRFPGHEHTRITNALPVGWAVFPLQETCVPNSGIQTGPFGSQLHQHDYSEEGIPVVMPKDMIGSRISTDTIARVPEEIRNRLSRHVMQVGDIVLARRGDIGRKAIVSERENGWLCGTGSMRLRPDPNVVAPRYLFETLGRSDVMGVIAGRAQGAIMPNLNLTILADVSIAVPPMRVQNVFLEYVGPMHRQIENLGEQNEKLRAARDLLLPRLISGDIEV